MNPTSPSENSEKDFIDEPVTTVNIAGLDKIDLVRRLWYMAKNTLKEGLMFAPTSIIEEALAFPCINVLCGKYLRVKLDSDEVITNQYNYENGPGLFELVVIGMRNELPKKLKLTDDQIRSDLDKNAGLMVKQAVQLTQQAQVMTRQVAEVLGTVKYQTILVGLLKKDNE
jgi:hypothetical protein